MYDVYDAGINIQSYDFKINDVVFKPLESFVVKANSPKHYVLGNLKGTPEHKVYYQGSFIPLKNHPKARLVDKPIQVVDCEVQETHNYLAEGQINHNTTTPGGKAIGYASSVRIKLNGGKPITKTVNGIERAIGIEVTAKIIKNKVAIPHREASFEIIFGKGIYENDQLFDSLREWCDKNKTNPAISKDNKKVALEGSGAWKTFTVSDIKTGVVDHEVKFYKSEFTEKVLNNQVCRPYLDTLIETALTMKYGDESHHTYAGVDINSQEELEAVKEENVVDL